MNKKGDDMNNALKMHDSEKDGIVEIPKTHFLHCPKKGFNFTRALDCIGCDKCEGLIQLVEDEVDKDGELLHAPIPFEQKYRIACASPTMRRTEIINI